MAQITVVYNSLEEMKEMAAQILTLGGEHNADITREPVTVPVTAQVTAAAQAAAIAQATAAAQQVTATATPQPVQAAPVTPAPTTVPTSTHEYTLDDLARAGMTLMDAGRQADVQGLLAKFGVTVLPALPKEQYGAFATALREMGAQI